MYSVLTLSQFIHYSLENDDKIWQELRVKRCQNKYDPGAQKQS